MLRAPARLRLTYFRSSRSLAPAARVAGMRAKPCLPPCTDARGPLCLELVDGDGKLCEPRNGPAACSGLRSCGPDCANQWLSPVQLFRSITRRHHWLLFIGDSDTRGLIIGLLQLLATAGYGAELASQSQALWLGGANNDSQASRMCHVDFSYDADARQVRLGLRLRLRLSPNPNPNPDSNPRTLTVRR